MRDFKRLAIAYIKKKLGIGSPSLWYGGYGYFYEYDYLINKRKEVQA